MPRCPRVSHLQRRAAQLRNDQKQLSTQLAEARRRSAELDAKLAQERVGKEDTVRKSALPSWAAASALAANFFNSAWLGTSSCNADLLIRMSCPLDTLSARPLRRGTCGWLLRLVSREAGGG